MRLPLELRRDLEWDHPYPLSVLYGEDESPLLPVFECGDDNVVAVGFAAPIDPVLDLRWCMCGRAIHYLSCLRDTKHHRRILRRRVESLARWEHRWTTDFTAMAAVNQALDSYPPLEGLKDLYMQLMVLRFERCREQRMKTLCRDYLRVHGTMDRTLESDIIPVRFRAHGLEGLIGVYEHPRTQGAEFMKDFITATPGAVARGWEATPWRCMGPPLTFLPAQLFMTGHAGAAGPLFEVRHSVEDLIADVVGHLLQRCKVDLVDLDDANIRGPNLVIRHAEDDEEGNTVVYQFYVPLNRILGRVQLRVDAGLLDGGGHMNLDMNLVR
jgi:hypothetical protein